MNEEQRDIGSLRLHPDAERVPMAAADDLRRLRDSLEEHGQQDPIDITKQDEILDGRTRWMLLRELGAHSIIVRVVPILPEQQTNYIVHRALDRRHLTMEQRAALNDLLRTQTVEVVPDPATGASIRIGLGQKQRAAKLGVARDTVKRWDEAADGLNKPSDPLPTHQRLSNGRIEPLRKAASRAKRRPRADVPLNISAPRNLLVARKARERLVVGLSQLMGMVTGLQGINYGNVCAVASPEELKSLRGQLDGLATDLRAIRGRLERGA